ncbi:MAG: acyltransferase [Candidatus Solibacter sp.]
MKPTKRVAELDGLRGLAILFVVLYHFRRPEGLLSSLWGPLGVGWIGVDLFFVLSGYLITGILLDSVGQPYYYRKFIAARSLRIFPLYYAYLILCLTLTYLSSYHRPLLSVRQFCLYGAYLGNFDVARTSSWPAIDLLSPLWSLQIEEQFYLTLPFIVAYATRKQLCVIFTGAVMLAFLVRLALWIAVPGNSIAAYVLMPCRMDALAIGGLIAIYKREQPEWFRSKWIPYGSLAATAGFAAICFWQTASIKTPVMRTLGYSVLDLMFGGWLATLIGGGQRHLAALCRWRPLVYLGTISYGVYLLHFPSARLAHYLASYVPNPSAHDAVRLWAPLAVTILAATMSWRFFESPILKWRNRLRLFSGQAFARVGVLR